jgi:hypothetical protein
MGFHDQSVERAIFYGGAKSIDECLPFILPNEKNLMDHKFLNPQLPSSQYNNKYCQLCVKKKKKHN